MSLHLTIDPLPGNSAVVTRFDGMTRRATDWAPAFGLIIDAFHKMERRRFASEGPGWAALAPSTLDYKASHGYTDKILVRTGTLFASLSGDGGQGTIEYMTPSSVFVGTDVPYAGYHQMGTPKMPRRQLVDINPAMAYAWGRILTGWLVYGEASAVADSVIAGAIP